VTNRH